MIKAQNFFLNTSLYAFPSLVTLIIITFSIKAFSPDDFAILGVLITLSAIAVLLTDFGYNYFGTRNLALKKADNNYCESYIISSAIERILIALLLSPMLYLFLINSPFSDDAFALTWISLLQPIGLAIMPVWAYQGIEKIKLMSAVNIVLRIIIIGIFYLFIEKLNIYQACILFSSQWIISGFIFHILNRSCMKMSFIFHIKNFSSSFLDRFHAAKYLYMTNVCIFLYTFLSILIISSILKSDEFNMVFTLDKYLKTILGFLAPLLATLMPGISRNHSSSKSHAIKELYNILFYVIKFGILIIVPFNIFYYSVFNAWEFGLIPFAFTLIFLPTCLNSIFGMLGLVGSGNNIELFKAIMPVSVLNLVLIYPAVTYFGLIGGIAMMLFSECLVSIRIIIRIKKLRNE